MSLAEVPLPGEPLPIDEDWPFPPGPNAFHGLAGDVARTIEPYSEADPIALLVQILAAFGSLVGRGAHVPVEADEHPARLFVALAGLTASARKGTSWRHVDRLFSQVDESFGDRLETGLSSGEGLIYRVRDADGDDDGEEIPDRRLLVVEPEFAGLLKVMERQGNTVSPVLRSAWDGTTLGTLTRNARLKASATHIAIIGHITIEELRRRLTEVEAANGFANRFLWVCVRRSKLLPEGAAVPQHALNALSTRLRDAHQRALEVGRIERDSEARTLWTHAYPELTTGRGGIIGALGARAEAQVTRLSLVYALLDEAETIGEVHLRAALELWRYVERSIAYVFGDATGNPDADAILRALRTAPDGLTRTEISSVVFSRNVTAGRIDRALAELLAADLAHFKKESSGGRPTERWHWSRR